jgi:hypothetical protein
LIKLLWASWLEGAFKTNTKDIFPLGCCGHRLCDHNQISIMLFKLAMLTSHSCTGQAFRSYERSIKLLFTIQWNLSSVFITCS